MGMIHTEIVIVVDKLSVLLVLFVLFLVIVLIFSLDIEQGLYSRLPSRVSRSPCAVLHVD